MKINLYLAHETEKAFGFKKEQKATATEKTENLIWFPKSQAKLVSSEDPDGGFLAACVVDVADWLIEKNNLADCGEGKTEEKTKPKQSKSAVVEEKNFEVEDDDDIPF
jgi:hypothetical protein